MAAATDPSPPTSPSGIGARVPRIDGAAKVTGAARYASDMAVSRPVFACLRTSDIALGRIASIDETEARAAGSDRHHDLENRAGQFKPIKIMSSGEAASTSMMSLQSPDIRHDGEIIAVVLAESFETARDASHRLKIAYDRRDPTAGFDDKGLVAEAATKADPRFKNAKVRDAAGAFGSKGAITPRTSLIALAAKRLGRPVKLIAARDQGFTISTYRAETRHHVQLGAGRDGKITALVHQGEEISGRPDSYKVGGTDVTTRTYDIPNITSNVTILHADRDTPGFMRAPSEVPSIALESAMDELAVALNMDPVELRRINNAQIDPVSKLPYSSRSLNQCYAAAATAFGWSRRDPRPMAMRDGDWQIGWGCATACYPSNIAASFARVTLAGGGARVEVAGHEVGTGAYTIYAQTAAQMLGQPVARIDVRMGDSSLPPAPVSGGSNNAASISNAVALACTKIRDALAAAAIAAAKSPLSGSDAAALVLVNGTLRAPDGRSEPIANALERVGGGVEILAGNEPKNSAPGALAGLRAGKLAFTGGTADKDSIKFAFGAEFVEVRVHRLTREVRVPRIVGAFAAGTIINPATARSQLLGGMI